MHAWCIATEQFKDLITIIRDTQFELKLQCKQVCAALQQWHLDESETALLYKFEWMIAKCSIVTGCGQIGSIFGS